MGRADETVVAGDFPLAFVVVAVIAASSAFIFSRLPREAGASLSAPKRAVSVQEEPASVAN
jgi:hypothetical protein